MEKEREYIKLLEILIRVAEANKGQVAGIDDRILDAESLLLKFFYHAASALYLYRSTTLRDINVSFFDPASINVLGRAALETFLIFHYVFVAQVSEEEKDFRYYSWALAGLLARQDFPVQTTEGKWRLERDKEIIRSLQSKLENNPLFKKLKKNKQKKLLDNRERWNYDSWTNIALSAGLSDLHANNLYRYLCDYAHTGNLSVIQVQQADTAKSQKTLCDATIECIMITMANIIKSYCRLFPKSNEVLLSDKDSAEIVDRWIKIGSSSNK
jgi:hypothetical protein